MESAFINCQARFTAELGFSEGRLQISCREISISFLRSSLIINPGFLSHSWADSLI